MVHTCIYSLYTLRSLGDRALRDALVDRDKQDNKGGEAQEDGAHQSQHQDGVGCVVLKLH